MNNKLLLLLIIIFITIFIISMLIFIIHYKNQHIEKFTSNILISYMNYPRISTSNDDNYTIVIQYFTNKASSNTINLSEKYDITASSPLNNLGINGYGTYYINSSFYVENPSPTNCISKLFINNNSMVTLKQPSDNTENVILILYPERFQFKGIEITLNSDAKNILENNIFLFALFNSTFSKINTTSNFDSNTITLSLVNINDIVIFDNMLYIVFSKAVKQLDILNIKIYGQPLNTAMPNIIIQNTASALDDKYINIFSENKYEQLPNINTDIQYTITTNENNNKYQERSIKDKFKFLLTNNKPPWAMYNAKNVSDNILYDVYNRQCRKAYIKGGYTIKNETLINNANITYLEGTPDTIITFPEGSLPENYTICVMSKYTKQSYRNRILTSKHPRNWLLGHWMSRKDGSMYNDDWIVDPEPKTDATTTDWRISCAKSNATNPSYSVIIDNNINKNKRIAKGNSISNAILEINGWPTEKSDFGLAYLIIWDVVLTDSELLTVSQALTNYSKTGEDLNINIDANTYGKYRNTPGLSALDIKIKTCTNENGAYWIKNDITGIAEKVYCIMDSECYGGGWMLAIKGTNNSSLFSYDGIEHQLNGRGKNGQFNKINHWTQSSTVQSDEPFDLDIDAKYNIFNHFKVSECLAIFDKKDTGGNVNKSNYGWTWHEKKFYNGSLSLKDFFNNSQSQFTYYSNDNYDFVAAKKYDPTYITRIFASSKDTFNQTIMTDTYTSKIWSRQDGFRAFGFNILPVGNYTSHKVRWGGLFNNESDISSSDVSGGIGLNNWNAGNYHTCCESSPAAPYKQMGFKWFIR